MNQMSENSLGGPTQTMRPRYGIKVVWGTLNEVWVRKASPQVHEKVQPFLTYSTKLLVQI
jgi:hypothetical protein